MKIRYLDDSIPCSDGRNGKPTGVTIGAEYEVVKDGHTHYTIINDDLKMARYNKDRFSISDNSPIMSLNQNINMHTHSMRMEIKELKRQLAEKETRKKFEWRPYVRKFLQRLLDKV